MIPRYSRPAMTAIWSPEAKFRIWFEIEAHAADALAELGVVPKEAAAKVTAPAEAKAAAEKTLKDAETKAKEAEAKKKQHVTQLKELRVRPGTDEHDLERQLKKAQEFLGEGQRVKFTLRFRGREMAHQELGTKLLNRVKDDTTKMAKVESEPRVEGRQMVMVLAPR